MRQSDFELKFVSRNQLRMSSVVLVQAFLLTESRSRDLLASRELFGKSDLGHDNHMHLHWAFGILPY